MNKQLSLTRIAAASLGAIVLSAAGGALADPPARVARLAYIDGPVSFAPAGENSWEYASVNRPLIAGDRLWVEAGGRDEVQVGGAALRMGGGTLVTLLNIDDRTTQLQLSQGRLNVRVRRMRPNDVFEIDTPNLALSIRQPGDYRIDVDPVGNATMVAVPRGAAEAYGDGNAYRLGAGQAYVFGGTDLRDARPVRADMNDDFDRWAQSRDRRIEQARSVRYVSPDLVGYEDLDDQGSWSNVPNYGNVWMPAHVGRDWAPYRDGHWAYVQPWGWTWVDDAPWGFAVSHYGRWAHFPQGWGWVPGPRAASPVYAPALVAFVSIGAGAYAQRERPVAWFPLAPREVYRPSYRASPNYITNINVTNTALDRRQIAREGSRVEYANRRVGGAVTAVPASAFAHSQPVSRSVVALPMAALAGAAIAHMAPVAPERGAMRGRGNPGHQPPQAVMQRQVLARTAPPAQFRQAPRPISQAPQMAGPAPRVLQQDRHGGGRQLRDVPMQQPVVAGPGGVPPAMQPQRGHFDRRMQRGQQGAASMPGQPAVAPVANAPMPQQMHGRDRIAPPPGVPAPPAVLQDQQNARDSHRGRMRPEQAAPQAAAGQPRMEQQAAMAQQQAAQQHNQQQAAEQQRNQQRAGQQQRNQQQAAEQQRNQQQAAEQQRNQQHAAEQQRNHQQAAEQQRNQQQAAEQHRNQQQAEARQRDQHAAEQQRAQQQAAAAQRAQQQQAAEQQRNQQHAAEQQRNQQQAEARQREQHAAEQQRAQQQQAAEHQRSQQQAAAQQQRAQRQAAADQRRAEHAQRPAPPPPPAAAPAPAAAAPAAAPQQARANEGKKEERRHRDHPEQN